MSVLVVPDDHEEFWPTIGWYVAEFLTGWDYLKGEQSTRWEGSIYGPGSLKGQRYRLDDEKLAATLRAYEVYPPEHRLGGRRRFKRVGLSWRKGTAKTEWAAQIAYAELHPDGPVRFDGWQTSQSGKLLTDVYGLPLPGLPRSVNDPYIPMVAFSEEQTEELAYGALTVIVGDGVDASTFDVGVDRILRLDYRGMPDGKAVALASNPNANDGARTTFQHFDETHRMHHPRLVQSHKTMLANIPKRPLDDPWSLETTTAGQPGAGSVAEGTHKYAEMILEGKVKDPRMFYFHREASAKWNLRDFDQRVKAIAEATGPSGEYGPGQFEEIAAQWDEPDADLAYLERVWCNRWTQSERQAFNVVRFDELSKPENLIPKGAFCTLGFDGARFKDSTAFVLTEIPTGKQMPVGLWERPADLPEGVDWEIPADEVHEVFRDIMRDYRIFRGYFDPPHWVEDVAKWANEYPDVVEEWWTNRRRPAAQAAKNYAEAITSGQVLPYLTPDGSFSRHIGHAGKVETNLTDGDGKRLWILGKLELGVTFDMAMAAVLSWQARLDALGDGAAEEETYVPRRLDKGNVPQGPPDVTRSLQRAVGIKYGQDAVMAGRK